jgi:TRAP-type C4-dicarboxylate transport system substrate-binding protein
MVGKYRMLNIRLFQILALVSVLALLSMFAVACGSEEPTATTAPEPTAMPEATTAPTAMAEDTKAPEPTKAATPTAMPAPAEDEEVFELKYSSPLSPPPFLISEVQKWWADEVARRSNGRIVWTDFYWSGALTKAGETLEAVQVGLADAGMVALPYYPGKLPLGNWTYAVPFGPGDPYVILEAAQRLYDEVPALREEVENYNMVFLAPSVIDTYNLTSKEPIVTFEDFDGIKIASIGSYHPKILEGAGATAIAMPVAERYQALQTGVIEAEFLPWDISHAYKYHDFNKNITWVNMGAAMPVGLGVNKDTFDSLPADLQQLMVDVAAEAVDLNASLILERRNAALEEWEELGITRHDMPAEDRSQWAEALSDIPGDWIKEMEDKGLPGREVMVTYIEILEELGHKFPRDWAADYR